MCSKQTARRKAHTIVKEIVDGRVRTRHIVKRRGHKGVLLLGEGSTYRKALKNLKPVHGPRAERVAQSHQIATAEGAVS